MVVESPPSDTRALVNCIGSCIFNFPYRGRYIEDGISLFFKRCGTSDPEKLAMNRLPQAMVPIDNHQPLPIGVRKLDVDDGFEPTTGCTLMPAPQPHAVVPPQRPFLEIVLVLLSRSLQHLCVPLFEEDTVLLPSVTDAHVYNDITTTIASGQRFLCHVTLGHEELQEVIERNGPIAVGIHHGVECEALIITDADPAHLLFHKVAKSFHACTVALGLDFRKGFAIFFFAVQSLKEVRPQLERKREYVGWGPQGELVEILDRYLSIATVICGCENFIHVFPCQFAARIFDISKPLLKIVVGQHLNDIEVEWDVTTGR